MSFVDLRAFLRYLDARGQLARIRAEVDPDQEVTVIQHRVLAAGGPALLFENVKGAGYRLVSNLFGTRERVAMVLGEPAAVLGQRVADLAHELMPPTAARLWQRRSDLRRLLGVRLKTVPTGPVLDTVAEPADLNRLPVLTCWPEDGGPFFTLPLVYTTDPLTGQGNLGMYRLQRYDGRSTGMHWQIEKGGGFHFDQACRFNRALPVSVMLGGPPALTIAAVTPLPEGIDERLLAAYMMGRPLEVVRRSDSGHRVPARAEFVIEGRVHPADTRMEGPFGDHFGHYSAAAPYPVLRVDRVLARRDAIYPATVVGKPIQEDYYIGEALQEMTLPLLKLIRPAVTDLWAYPETGFHPLAVFSVRQRYPHEALKHALGLLGEGQVSLTKVMIAVDPDVNVRDFKAVSRAIWRHLSNDGLHLLSPTAQDTLDFTGPVMNTGSRLILLANAADSGPMRTASPPAVPAADAVHGQIQTMAALGPAFLMVQLSDRCTDAAPVIDALRRHPGTRSYLFHVLVSDDIAVDDPVMSLWGWFTRFDPQADLYPDRREIIGNRLVLQFPIAVDARWKKGYPNPVAFDPDVARKVARNWASYGIRCP